MAVATRRRAFPKGEGRWTKVQANALLRAVEDMFHRRDIDALVKGFTEDCVFRFAEQPEQRGRDPLRKFFTARLERQKNYRLKKTLLALDRNLIANLWEETWDVWEQGGERKSSIMQPLRPEV